MKRSIAAAMCALALSGCARTDSAADAAAQKDLKPNPQMQALEQAEQAGLLEEKSAPALSAAQAAERASGLLAAGCTVSVSEETLTVGEAEQARAYYVLAVADAAGVQMGQLAVDCETGETWQYMGEGTLGALSAFPLYDAAAAGDWTGEYASAAGARLVVEQQAADALTYRFSDGTEGAARVIGEAARSEDGEIHFLLADGIVTVSGGGLTGNYSAAVPTAEEDDDPTAAEPA